MQIRIVACALAGMLIVAPSLRAQTRATSGPWELGIDAGVMFGLDDPNVTVVSVPIQDFRLGYFVSNKAELEPRVTINSIHGGGGSITTYDFQLGLLLLPSGDRVGNGLYLRPFVGVNGLDATGAGNNNTGYLGGGVGLKIPFADRRMATRMEANYTHGFSGGGSNIIGVGIGLSWFTR